MDPSPIAPPPPESGSSPRNPAAVSGPVSAFCGRGRARSSRSSLMGQARSNLAAGSVAAAAALAAGSAGHKPRLRGDRRRGERCSPSILIRPAAQAGSVQETESFPQYRLETAVISGPPAAIAAAATSGAFSAEVRGFVREWWARLDSNQRPDRYERCAPKRKTAEKLSFSSISLNLPQCNFNGLHRIACRLRAAGRRRSESSTGEVGGNPDFTSAEVSAC